MKPEALLTFDLEFWSESLSIQKYLKNNEQDSLDEFTDKLLDLLKAVNSTATFFITGRVLNKEPEIVKKISNNGHEIAIHSLDHKALWDKTAEEFDTEIKKMITEIEKVVNKRPIGHRAVNFSLNQKTSWALGVLAKNEIKYDSSVFPFKLSSFLLPMFKDSLYGIRSRLFSPYKINLDNPSRKNPESPLVEIPVSVYHYGKFKLPLTGGIYIRLIPWLIFKFLLKKKSKKELICLHFHPFDFSEQSPDIKMPLLKKFIKYYNTKNTFKKFKKLTQEFTFISIEQYLKEVDGKIS